MVQDITDDYMLEMRSKARSYTVVLLRMTDAYDMGAGPGSEQFKVIWAHGKRNYELRARGVMPLVGPLIKPPFAGLCVFTLPAEEVQAIMEKDPAVMAGYFTFETMPWRTFPGDGLPA